MKKSLLTTTLAVLALAAAGCGGSDEAEAEEAVTPAEAATEVGEIKTLLDEAVEEYRGGDAAAAEETVGDAYLEHFEKVEHPLEEIDHEFMEDLEHTISTTIRERIKQGAPADDVAQLVDETKVELDRAQDLLEQAG
jgi:ABC-type glycerol-3-phosphate transport system substrate-binding protein